MSATPRTIKKYPNRRLYDTANSGYITLVDVKQMVLDNIDFQVVDAKSGDDLTRSILLQIILDEESGGVPMWSSEMLAQMIRFYGSAQQTIMGQYMEQNVKAFLAIQKKLQDQARQVYGDKMLLTPDLWKQFMQMQAPAMQGMLGNYLEQSAKLFMDMQQRMQDQMRRQQEQQQRMQEQMRRQQDQQRQQQENMQRMLQQRQQEQRGRGNECGRPGLPPCR